jgi:hypothetical protein
MWGTDTNNIYAIGHSAFGGNASLFYYDGTKWNRVLLTKGEGGFINSYLSFIRIDGSSKNDIWAVGYRGSYYGYQQDSSLVIHYDGSSWREVEMDRCKSGMQGLKVFGPNNVYMGGTYGEIYHFDGNTITKTILDTNLVIHAIGGDEQKMFAAGSSIRLYPNEYKAVFSKENGGPWQTMIKSSEADYYKKKDYAVSDFYPLGGGRYFASDQGIYLLEGNTWQSIYTSGINRFYLMRGTSATNIFARTGPPGLFHWNGVDWQPVNLPEGVNENRPILSMWVHKKYIYFAYYYSLDVNIIYRGAY